MVQSNNNMQINDAAVGMFVLKQVALEALQFTHLSNLNCGWHSEYFWMFVIYIQIYGNIIWVFPAVSFKLCIFWLMCGNLSIIIKEYGYI